MPAPSITCFANVFDELDASRARRGTEDGHATLGACVGDTRGGGGVRPDDDEIDAAIRGKARNRLRVGHVDGDVLRNVRGPGVAGRDDQLDIARVTPARPCQRVLTSPAADDQDSRYSHSMVEGGLLEMS